MVNANDGDQPRRFRRYLAILLLLALLAYGVFFSWQSWRDAKNEEASHLATIAELEGKALDGYFVQLEIALQSLGLDLPDTRNQPDLDRAFFLVNRFQLLHPELLNIVLTRADGQILLTGNIPHSRELPTLADDPSFIQFRAELQRGASLVIGQPVLGHIGNGWSISARHGVMDQSGKLIYILSVNFPIDMLQRYWVDLPGRGVAGLWVIRDDGYMVSRYPVPDVAQLDNLYGEPLADATVDYLRANSFPRSGQVEIRDGTVFGGAIRVMQRLQHYPLTLIAEMPFSAIRVTWWKKVQTPYFLLALMLLGILLGCSRSLLHRRVWSMEQRREAIRRKYEDALLGRSQNEILMFDASTLQLTYANDNALNNLGYSIEEIKRQNFLSLHPGWGIESFARLIEPLRQKEQESIKYQTVQLRANGSTYPVEVNLLLIAADDGKGFLAIITDLTALKQAEENVRNFNAPVERRSRRSNSRTASPDKAA